MKVAGKLVFTKSDISQRFPFTSTSSVKVTLGGPPSAPVINKYNLDASGLYDSKKGLNSKLYFPGDYNDNSNFGVRTVINSAWNSTGEYTTQDGDFYGMTFFDVSENTNTNSIDIRLEKDPVRKLVFLKFCIG